MKVDSANNELLSTKVGDDKTCDNVINIFQSSGRRMHLSRNPIHNYFSFDDLLEKSICKTCGMDLIGKNPTALTRHIRAKHENEYEKFVVEFNAEATRKLLVSKFINEK